MQLNCTSPGLSGVCIPCDSTGVYVCPTCPMGTQYWSGTACKACVINTNCLTGQSCVSGDCQVSSECSTLLFGIGCPCSDDADCANMYCANNPQGDGVNRCQ